MSSKLHKSARLDKLNLKQRDVAQREGLFGSTSPSKFKTECVKPALLELISRLGRGKIHLALTGKGDVEREAQGENLTHLSF